MFAVHFRHVQVEEDKVGTSRELIELPEGLDTVGRGDALDRGVYFRQGIAEELEIVNVVV